MQVWYVIPPELPWDKECLVESAWSLNTTSECNTSRKCWTYQSSINWRWVLVFHVPLLMLTPSTLLQCGWSGAAA